MSPAAITAIPMKAKTAPRVPARFFEAESAQWMRPMGRRSNKPNFIQPYSVRVSVAFSRRRQKEKTRKRPGTGVF